MKTQKKLLILTPILVLSGCGSDHKIQEIQESEIKTLVSSPYKSTPIGQESILEYRDNTSKQNRAFTYVEQVQIRTDGLSYINSLRQNAGMISLSANYYLNNSAYNHAHYLMLNNFIGHGENSLDYGFTGETSANRAVAAGYQHKYVSENLSTGNTDVNNSIDGLFSAIYHRFNFLNFISDEIGIGADSSSAHAHGQAYNYNLGLSHLSRLCAENSFNSYGTYYQSICANPSFKIEASKYKNALSQNKELNPSYVLWPHNDQNNTITTFFEEYPDPLPDCSVSGYPISIQFNPQKNTEINIQNFKLYNSDNNYEITNTRVLDEESDPNSRFSANEAALFPLERLSWNTNYTADVLYTENGIQKNITWSFKTKTLPHPYYTIQNANTTLNIKSGQTYLFYLPPENCNDNNAGYRMTYSSNLLIENSFYDNNIIQLTVTGRSGVVNISPYNGRNFTLNITK